MQSRREFLLGGAAAVGWTVAAPAQTRGAPAPYGVTPSARQLAWHRRETYAFLHFTINTFTDKEWGYGDESPALFNPTAFDADAVVAPLARAGMTGVILTCKHHDGFCLWPTKTTTHSVRKSPWREGRGDVVREISEAAKRVGLAFGVYVSPWDRNHPQYGLPEYIDVYREQLRELLTGYGPIFEVWHDGANGGDGYYGGAREKRTIDKGWYYDWPGTWKLVRELQPDAVIFSDVGPDVRWVGNERGVAGETCWATITPQAETGDVPAPGNVRAAELTTGTRNGKLWLPAECDVSIRPGWFWHEKENARVKSGAQLLDLYFKSVGRGASFLLNIPPDRRGLLHENDIAALDEFGKLRRAMFARDLASGARVSLAGAGALVDGKPETYWAAPGKAAEIVLELAKPAEFDIVRLREAIQFGQRIERIAIDVWREGAWQPFGDATSIGACRLVRATAPASTNRVRMRVTESPVPPVLSEIALFRST